MGTFFNRKKIYLHIFLLPQFLPDLSHFPTSPTVCSLLSLKKKTQKSQTSRNPAKNHKMKIKTNEKKKKRTVSQNKYHCFVLANFFWVWNKVCIKRVYFYKNAVEFSIYVCTCVLMWIYLDTQCTKICFGDSLQEVLTNYTSESLFLCACRKMVKGIETECRGSGG